MAGTPAEGSLLAVIGDEVPLRLSLCPVSSGLNRHFNEDNVGSLRFTGMPCLLQDTVTGFLLAGVGNVDLRKKTNFLVVNESMILPYIMASHLQHVADLGCFGFFNLNCPRSLGF